MESYEAWFGEGAELSVLRMLGLFDRPAREKALEALLKSPAILCLTESLTDLAPTEWRTVLARLRRARLLAGVDLHNPGCLDTHPLLLRRLCIGCYELSDFSPLSSLQSPEFCYCRQLMAVRS
jgi:hypothetical protein